MFSSLTYHILYTMILYTEDTIQFILNSYITRNYHSCVDIECNWMETNNLYHHEYEYHQNKIIYTHYDLCHSAVRSSLISRHHYFDTTISYCFAYYLKQKYNIPYYKQFKLPQSHELIP